MTQWNEIRSQADEEFVRHNGLTRQELVMLWRNSLTTAVQLADAADGLVDVTAAGSSDGNQNARTLALISQAYSQVAQVALWVLER